MNTLPSEDSKTAIGVDGNGQMAYGTAAASGHVEIELPALPGSPNPTERILVRGFGGHVIGKVEASMKRQPYMQSGPVQTPAQVLQHYASVAKGSGLTDPATTGQLESLARGIKQEKDAAEYFRRDVKPFLLSLLPKRRAL
jgi:hypothetical protein